MKIASRCLSPLRRPSFPIQVQSDLHLELGHQYATYRFPATAPFLLLAGDVGCLKDYAAYKNFLSAQASRFDRIFLVLGNHEFHGSEYQDAIATAKSLCQEPCLDDKVTLLHKTRWDDPASEFTILGCTLWSRVMETATETAQRRVSDFSSISHWTVEMHNQRHHDESSWLFEQVDILRQLNRRVLIATHHAPLLSNTASPRHHDSPIKSCFGTDLIGQHSLPGVKTWVFGHTHYNTDFQHTGIRVLANQRGYVYPEKRQGREQGECQFDAAKFIQA
ncbi:hypothetical protein VHEMI00784 [[Torrubiella] hemipterigena]|uniref:Calcineurin-like phosphoesterase domain-containing protein n=1 Tax=[Torrubiella] hemipterigena TaxID=1531966 RepID=A0A0A1T3E5_9HYPO|nr:hypothetical protein VHEMI00784 [[Torrubiella] hemipterigena]